MSAKIFRLDEHRTRRRPQTSADMKARDPGYALDRALRAVAVNPSKDFASNARLFQRTFKEAIEHTNALLRASVVPLDSAKLHGDEKE
jgi:hypothetical protein